MAIPALPDTYSRTAGPAPFSETAYGRRKVWHEAAARAVFLAMTLMMIAPLVAIVTHLFVEAWPALGLEFLLDIPRNRMTEGGIWPAFIGTIYLVVISLAVAAPIGVLAAVYLNEYAKDTWFNRIINLAVINLAGVPSIVHALFGLGAFVYAARLGYSVIAASAVPMSFREACWNVGASRWQTIRGVVLPNSISGILTGVILQVSRAAGETAPVMFTGAVLYKAVERGTLFPYYLDDQCMALSMHLYVLTTQVPNVADAVPYATAVVLLGSVLLVNALAIGLRVWLRNRKRW
jgi:phosphate transport system permease protein